MPTISNDGLDLKTLTNLLFEELNGYYKDFEYGPREYLYQKHADYYLTRMPVMVPTPPFEIDQSHLSTDLRKKLADFKTKHGSIEFRKLLNGAVGRLFENLNPETYRSTIYPILWVSVVDENKNKISDNSLVGDYDSRTVEARHIRETFNSVKDPIQFLCDTLAKEIKDDDKMVRHLLYTIFSSATKNPINLAINAPSGVGKSYGLNNVLPIFPEENILALAGQTDKALFHRKGTLVVRESGSEAELSLLLLPLEQRLKKIQEEKEASDDNKVLVSEEIELEKQIRELKSKAVKVIFVGNQVLAFLDTPPEKLFSALMPLMSHDRYEITYEYVDTNDGITTNVNILRGYPSFIFTQASDFSGYERAEEIQRRFIVSNPNMNVQKYKNAADLITLKYSVPDFVYQQRVICDEEKEKAKLIATKILRDIQGLNAGIKPNKNNVIIPFGDTVRQSLSITKGLDMTYVSKFFNFLALMPVVKSHNRPKLVIEYQDRIERDGTSTKIPDLVIPIATFEDLQETLYLMENSSGVRPFINEWFEKVFMSVFNGKTEPDSKVRGLTKYGEEIKIEESRIAVTTDQLREKHKEVLGQTITIKKLLQNYMDPLRNNGLIDSINSELDKRSKIFYPLAPEKYIHLFRNDNRNNLLQDFRLNVKDLTTYPDKTFLISNIDGILEYSSKDVLFSVKNFYLKDHEGGTITVDELVDKYFNKPEAFFIKSQEHFPEEHFSNPQNNTNSEDLTNSIINPTDLIEKPLKKLFQIRERNKLIYPESKAELETIAPTPSQQLDLYLEYIKCLIAEDWKDVQPPLDYDPDKELEGLPTIGGTSYMDKINKWFEEQSKI